MMNQQDRAKQFQPFDAMKGLQRALREREERHRLQIPGERAETDGERDDGNTAEEIEFP